MSLIATYRAKRTECPRCSSRVVTTPDKDRIKCVSDGCGWTGTSYLGGTDNRFKKRKRKM